MKKAIALFDFDGTISTIDSTYAFYKFLYRSKYQYYLHNYVYCFKLIILMKLGFVDYIPLKNLRLDIHTSRFNNDEFEKLAGDFYSKAFSGLLNPKAMERIRWHKENGHEVWVISASYDFLLTQWSIDNDIKLITNTTGVKKFKRYSLNKDVNFEAKIEYLSLQVNLEDYSEIYAYGDSEGDASMLSIADFKFYKPFRD